jgi:Spy/CpxP family protein refolding chaperone
MKRKLSPILFFSAAICLAAFAAASAQDVPTPENVNARQRPEGQPVDRPNLLRELELSPDQVRQIRLINQERKPQMDIAARRLRQANRALDEAIYSDTVNEQNFAARLAEFQAAQAQIARLRFESELNVRRVLTPEQLLRFRELRRRFAERFEDRPGPRSGPERRRLRQLGRPPVDEKPF